MALLTTDYSFKYIDFFVSIEDQSWYALSILDLWVDFVSRAPFHNEFVDWFG